MQRVLYAYKLRTLHLLMIIYFLYGVFSVEKVSKASSASMDRGRTLTSFDKMERTITGRKMDLVFFRQRHEYGYCECSRYDGQTKELYDDGFKMVKVLKDILYNFYMKSLGALRDMTLVGFLLFGK